MDSCRGGAALAAKPLDAAGAADVAAARATDTLADVALRRAVAQDRAAVVQFVLKNHLALSDDCPEEWASQVQDLPEDFSHLLSAEAYTSGVYFVAERRGKLVGSSGITPKGDDRWGLTAVSVAEDCRGRGLGDWLVRLAMAAAQDAGAIRLELVTLKEQMGPAWRLYERAGFKRFAEELVRQEPRPMTVLCYAKDLPVAGVAPTPNEHTERRPSLSSGTWNYRDEFGCWVMQGQPLYFAEVRLQDDMPPRDLAVPSVLNSGIFYSISAYVHEQRRQGRAGHLLASFLLRQRLLALAPAPSFVCPAFGFSAGSREDCFVVRVEKEMDTNICLLASLFGQEAVHRYTPSQYPGRLQRITLAVQSGHDNTANAWVQVCERPALPEADVQWAG